MRLTETDMALEGDPTVAPSGIVLFPRVLDRYPAELRDRHLDAMEVLQEAYIRQKSVSTDMTEGEFAAALKQDPRLGLSYYMARRAQDSPLVSAGLAKFLDPDKLVAVAYPEDPGFGRIYNRMAGALKAIEPPAAQLEDASLAMLELEILQRGFSDRRPDSLHNSMGAYLNLRAHPKFSLWAGLLDRYNNPNTFAFQAWSTEQDRWMSEEISHWASGVLKSVRREVDEDRFAQAFVVGNAGIYAGLAAEKIWQGNTMPSDPEQAEVVGHKIMLFENVAAWKTQKYVVPILDKIVPQEVRDSENWQLDRARRAIIAGHEVGHAAQRIPQGAPLGIGKWYQTLREGYADAFGLWSVLSYPQHIIRPAELPTAFYYDMARMLYYVEGYTQAGTHFGDVSHPYSYSGAMKLNTLLSEGVIGRNSDGTMEYSDFAHVRRSMKNYQGEVDEVNESRDSVRAEEFVHRKVSEPVDYLHLAA